MDLALRKTEPSRMSIVDPDDKHYYQLPGVIKLNIQKVYVYIYIYKLLDEQQSMKNLVSNILEKSREIDQNEKIRSRVIGR